MRQHAALSNAPTALSNAPTGLPLTTPPTAGPRTEAADAATLSQRAPELRLDIIFGFMDAQSETSMHYIRFSKQYSEHASSTKERPGMQLVSDVHRMRSFIHSSNTYEYCRVNSRDTGTYKGVAIQRKGHIQCNQAMSNATAFYVEITGSNSVSLQVATDDDSDYYCQIPGPETWTPRYIVALALTVVLIVPLTAPT